MAGEETQRILTLEFSMVKIKGGLAFRGSKSAMGPDEKHTYTEMKMILPIDFQDWLFLDHSSEEGYMVTITPVKQPLIVDDDSGQQWKLPGLGEPGSPDGPPQDEPKGSDGPPDDDPTRNV